MPPLVRLYIRQVLAGFGLSLVWTGLVLWLDVAGLGRLTGGTQGGWIAALMLFVFHGLVFSGVQFAISVMRLQESGARPPRGGKRAPAGAAPAAVPLPVRAAPPRT